MSEWQFEHGTVCPLPGWRLPVVAWRARWRLQLRRVRRGVMVR